MKELITDIAIGIIVALHSAYTSFFSIILNYKELIEDCKNNTRFYKKDKNYLHREYMFLIFAALFLLVLNVFMWINTIKYLLKIVAD